MSDNVYEVLFNRILDITACIHIPLKSFAMYVVIRHTPPQLLHYSYFILNAMFWNFLMNLVFIFIHIFPLFPALCFRVDGISTHFIDNEVFGQTMFILTFVLATQCGLAMLFAFPHRYIVFAHPQFSARIKPAWVFGFCAAVHVLVFLTYVPVGIVWTVSYDEYPNKAELPARLFAFCLYPNVMEETPVAAAYLLLLFIAISAIILSSVLFLVDLQRQERVVHTQTLALQRKLFISLIVITSITVLLGGIPLEICISGTLFPHIPHIREVCMICIIILCNHGTIYAVAYLVLFKAYRDAVKRMFSKAMETLLMAKTHSTATQQFFVRSI